MNTQKTQLTALFSKLIASVRKLRRYSLLCFIILITLIYGFLLIRINLLAGHQPTESEISNQVDAAQIPHIDKSVVKQLQALEDNSVSVHTLFNQARSNPFQ